MLESINNNKIVYQLTVEDLQTVAKATLERTLTNNEISLLEEIIGDYIDWFDVIHCAIISKLHK